MKPLEERLRDAMNAAGEIVPEREPRPLPAPGQRRRRWLRFRTPLRLPPWGMQLRVAAAVMAVLVIFVAISVAFDEPEPPDREPGMPRFFVASYLADEGDSSRLEVRETTTGRLLDSRNAPAGVNFGDVAAAGDGVFYATSEKRSGKPCQTITYLVKVSGSGAITRLEPIVGGPMPGISTGANSLAVTPGGRMGAIALDGCDLESPTNRPTLTVFDPATGRRQHQWRTPAGSSLAWLSWSADGRYLFFSLLKPGQEVEELRRLDTSRQMKDLVRDSSLIRTAREPKRFSSILSSADGHHVYLTEGNTALESVLPGESGSPEKGTNRSPERMTLELLEISAETGRTERVIRRLAVETISGQALESDASGRYLFTDLGILDLRSSGPLRGVPYVSGVSDVAW